MSRRCRYAFALPRPGDEERIAKLVRGLAEYEKLLDQAVATPAALAAALVLRATAGLL